MSAPCNQTDVFAVLPGPVLGEVLVNLDDLASLHSLHRASRVVSSVLREAGTGPRIIDKILDRGERQPIRILVRKFAFLRRGVNPVSSVDAFIDQYITEDSYARLPRDMLMSTICDVLAAAATVRYLAHAGMHEMIGRCMALELSRLQNPRLKYIPNAFRTRSMWNSEYFPVPKPPRERYQQRDVGPPSAAEEQRAMCAIWRLLLIWELHSAVSGPSPRWHWERGEVCRLQGLNVDEIWHRSLWDKNLEPIRTMADCSCLSPALASPMVRYNAAKSLARNAQWHYSCGCLPLSMNPSDEQELSQVAPGYSFVCGDLARSYTSPVRYVKFRVFRRFGFAIWDYNRMEGLGLLYQRCEDPPRPLHQRYKNPRPLMAQSPRSPPDLYVRWESILSAEDLEEIEGRRKHYWPGREMVIMENGYNLNHSPCS